MSFWISSTGKVSISYGVSAKYATPNRLEKQWTWVSTHNAGILNPVFQNQICRFKANTRQTPKLLLCAQYLTMKMLKKRCADHLKAYRPLPVKTDQEMNFWICSTGKLGISCGVRMPQKSLRKEIVSFVLRLSRQAISTKKGHAHIHELQPLKLVAPYPWFPDGGG